MIIDCNATLGAWPFRPLLDNDPHQFVELMDRHSIDRAWVSPFEAVFYKSAQEANEAFGLKLAGLQDRLVQLPVINPAFPAWEDDLAAWLERAVPGVRLYPAYHGYALDDAVCGDLLQRISEAGRFVQIAVRVQDERLHHPLAQVPPVDLAPLADLAAQLPQMPFVVLNPAVAEIRASIGSRSPENVLFDISHVEGIGGVGYLAQEIGAEHILFGTHAPFFYIESSLLKMVEADLSEEDRELILHSNAQRIIAE